MDSGLFNVLACVFLVASRLSTYCLSACVQHTSKSSERILTKFSEKVSNDKICNCTVSCTMHFANRLPFSQHLVPRYSESPAVPPNFLNLGDGKNFFSSLKFAPSLRHCVLEYAASPVSQLQKKKLGYKREFSAPKWLW